MGNKENKKVNNAKNEKRPKKTDWLLHLEIRKEGRKEKNEKKQIKLFGKLRKEERSREIGNRRRTRKSCW